MNVVDMQTLSILAPETVHDLPLDKARWDQQVVGYDLTIVSGVVTFEGGVHTGAMPGSLIREHGRTCVGFDRHLPVLAAKKKMTIAWNGEHIPGCLNEGVGLTKDAAKRRARHHFLPKLIHLGSFFVAEACMLGLHSSILERFANSARVLCRDVAACTLFSGRA